ncbi:MAG: hypothetical protein Q4P34_01805 [Tissierellia bacterium]|nr:hypothetical protein [Tissierellia bacterium]
MLVEQYQPKDAQALHESSKYLLGDTVEKMLKTELDEHLDYEYGQAPLLLDTRNDRTKKTVNSSYKNIGLNISRDSKVSF